MKTKHAFRSMIALAMLFTSPAFANGGTEAGNGGSRTGLEFGEIALSVSRHLRSHRELTPEIDRRQFERTVMNLRPVVFEDATSVPCLIDNARQDVTACNHPTSQSIDLAGRGWEELPRVGTSGKVQLAIHEVLGLMNIEDPSGAMSLEIAESMLFSSQERLLGFWCSGTRGAHITRTQNSEGLRFTHLRGDSSSPENTTIFSLSRDGNAYLWTQHIPGHWQPTRMGPQRIPVRHIGPDRPAVTYGFYVPGVTYNASFSSIGTRTLEYIDAAGSSDTYTRCSQRRAEGPRTRRQN